MSIKSELDKINQLGEDANEEQVLDDLEKLSDDHAFFYALYQLTHKVNYALRKRVNEALLKRENLFFRLRNYRGLAGRSQKGFDNSQVNPYLGWQSDSSD